MSNENKFIGLDNETAASICRILTQYPEVEAAILYGSRAKGTHKTFSDIDLTLTGEVSVDTLLRIHADLDESDIPYLFDLSVFNALTNPELIEHIHRVGQVIYRKTRLLSTD